MGLGLGSGPGRPAGSPNKITYRAKALGLVVPLERLLQGLRWWSVRVDKAREAVEQFEALPMPDEAEAQAACKLERQELLGELRSAEEEEFRRAVECSPFLHPKIGSVDLMSGATTARLDDAQLSTLIDLLRLCVAPEVRDVVGPALIGGEYRAIEGRVERETGVDGEGET